MILVVGTFGGLIGGLLGSLLWFSVDMLLGTSTLTENKFVGTLGLSVAIANVGLLGIVAYAEMCE